jgi:hypothetical protein
MLLLLLLVACVGKSQKLTVREEKLRERESCVAKSEEETIKGLSDPSSKNLSICLGLSNLQNAHFSGRTTDRTERS